MRKSCPYCGDRHICIDSRSISAGSVTPPSKETVEEFAAESAATILPLVSHQLQDPRVRLSSSALYDLYVDWAHQRGQAPLGRRTFNNTLVALGWQRRKISGYYNWVSFPGLAS